MAQPKLRSSSIFGLLSWIKVIHARVNGLLFWKNSRESDHGPDLKNNLSQNKIYTVYPVRWDTYFLVLSFSWVFDFQLDSLENKFPI